MSESFRVQFRINKRSAAKLCELAEVSRTTPSLFAKKIFQAALEGKDVDPRLLSEDLLVVRAGMEALFRRNGRFDELADAVRDVRTRRREDDSQDVRGVS